MAFKFSTGFRNAIMGGSSVSAALTGGQIRIYSGPVPASADDALSSNQLLTVITDNGGGGGLEFGTVSQGTLAKLETQIWKGTNVASGTATFFRFVQPSDNNSASTTAVRVQGNVGVAGADMNLSSVQLVSGEQQFIDYFAITFPA